jgi:hypothetical protein
MSTRHRFARIAERIEDNQDRLTQVVQLSAAIDVRTEIVVRRQNLNGDLLGRVVVTADQECIDRQLYVFSRIADAVGAEFKIKQRGSIALTQDFIGLSGEQRPDTATQPEALFFDRAERFL